MPSAIAIAVATDTIQQSAAGVWYAHNHYIDIWHNTAYLPSQTGRPMARLSAQAVVVGAEDVLGRTLMHLDPVAIATLLLIGAVT